MKILLFGGTFDPPHKGHMNNLQAAMDCVQPDKVIVMPAGIPPHKKASTTDAALRLAMCECFTALSPKVEVSDWEVRQGGRNYSVNTVEMLHSRYPADSLYMCVGSDMLLGFTRWYRWQDILRMTALVVESRETGDAAALHAAAEALRRQGATVLLAQAQAFPCASSDIRSGRVPRSRWEEVLPPNVIQIVKDNGLYTCDADKNGQKRPL